MRGRARVAVAVCVLQLLIGVLAAAPASADTRGREPLAEGFSAYPRLIRLDHQVHAPWRNGLILVSVTSSGPRGTYARIFASNDEGRSFHQIGAIHDPAGGLGMCCGTIYELPQRVGNLPAGTILWAATYRQKAGPGRRIGIRVWASLDGGRSWRFLAEPVRSDSAAALWEPEFIVDDSGTLWLHYADETYAPRYSQVLARVPSQDGVHWGSKQITIALDAPSARPGMPIIRKLPDGRYYMSYEICNYGRRYCNPYFRISADGRHWGDPHVAGHMVTTAAGNTFEHAQTIAVFPGGAAGPRIMMVGQIYVDAAGNPLPGNGRTLLSNSDYGHGPWHEVPAPVHISNPGNNWCRNYSSAILPVRGGSAILQIATTFNENGVCQAYFDLTSSPP